MKTTAVGAPSAAASVAPQRTSAIAAALPTQKAWRELRSMRIPAIGAATAPGR